VLVHAAKALIWRCGEKCLRGYVRSEAFGRRLPEFLEQAKQIDVKWVRYGAYAVIGIGSLAYMFTCLFLPFFEETFLKELDKRNVRT